MSSKAAQVADAVRDVIAALDLGFAFECVRTYADGDDESIGRELVLVEVVMPETTDVALESRGTTVYTLDIAIVLRKRIAAEQRDGQTGALANEEIDPLTSAVEQIADALIADAFTSLDATWQQTRIDQLFDRERLRSAGIFEGTITVTFEARKALT